MALAAGTRLGPYEVIAPIGAGGMGEVYRARDSRLKRDVALKVLPESFADNPDRLARFEREARVLASLNHPNIAQIYGVEQDALVMEIVEGAPPKGPLRFEDAWRIASQIADGLQFAHDRGIVHRDLKPANVKITADGTVKLLDFGLAKAFSDPTVATTSNVEDSPTMTLDGTRAGVILGTAAYMSPEQAKGKTVDKRADIWAFGVLFYELLTGERLFRGEDASEVLAQILTKQPDLGKAPVKARRLLRDCLERDPKQRLRDIGDAKRLLIDVSETTATGSRHWIGWGAAALCAMALAVMYFLQTIARPDQPKLTFTLVVPPSSLLEAVSPDGSSVAYWDDNRLNLRRFGSLKPDPLPGSTGSSILALWSPDSQSIAFHTFSGQLRKMHVPDGAPEEITNAPATRGANWGDKRTIVLATIPSLAGSRMYSVSSQGGELQPLDVPGLSEGRFYEPELLPGGEQLLFSFAGLKSDGTGIYLANFQGGRVSNPVLLFKNDTAVRFTPAGGGRILFVRDDNLYTQKLDTRLSRVEGNPELIEPNVASLPTLRIPEFSVARTGTVVWRPGSAKLAQLTILDRQGKRISTAGPPSPVYSIGLSPDEKQAFVSSEAGTWLVEPGQPGRLNLGQIMWRLWSSDSSRLLGVFSGNLMERSLTASGTIHELGRFSPLEPRGNVLLQDISVDDGAFLYSQGGSVALRRPDSQSPAILVRNAGESILSATFSPDRHWILYVSQTSQGSGSGIYVQSYPGSGLRKQIAEKGNFAVWRKDGKEILYWDQDHIWSVPVDGAGKEFQFGTPHSLFSIRPLNFVTAAARPLAVNHDGSRIYILQTAEQPDSNLIHVRMGLWK